MAMTIRDIAREVGSRPPPCPARAALPNIDPGHAGHRPPGRRAPRHVVSPAASRLASGRAGSIAVITPWIAVVLRPAMLSGIERVLAGSDLDLLLSSIGDPSETHPIAAAPAPVLVPPSTSSSSRCRPDRGASARSSSPTCRSPLIDTEREGCWSGRHRRRQRRVMASLQHLISLGHEAHRLISGRDADAVPSGEPLARLSHPRRGGAAVWGPTSRPPATSRSTAASR